MRIGIPKEIKNHEYRVGLMPAPVRELIAHGHEVLVESGAGLGVGMSDASYEQAGAQVLASAESVFSEAELIVKVKEPLADERKRLRPDQVLFTFLHLAPDVDQTRDLIDSGATCIAYETIPSADGRLPILAPMSMVAGRLSIQAGAKSLEKHAGGRGLLLSGVAGVPSGNILIIGGGVVGSNAAALAHGMRARVTVLDRSPAVLERLDSEFAGQVRTRFSTRDALSEELREADLVIGAVLLPGASAPHLIDRAMLKTMKPGSVFVDVAIDQGGCAETSKATTHMDPTYIVDDIVHYCVANMPGATPLTSTLALNNISLPYVLDLADKGWKKALSDSPLFLKGLNVWNGKVTCAEVATSQGLEYTEPGQALA